MEQLFTMKRLEDFVPADHPLRPIRLMVNEALVRLDGLLSGMYACSAKGGRPTLRRRNCCGPCCCRFYRVRSKRLTLETDKGYDPARVH